MSTIYTGDPSNNPTSLTMPADGDIKPVASVRVSLEGLADGLAHAQWPATNNAKTYPLASRVIVRHQRITPISQLDGSFEPVWRPAIDGTFVQSSVASAYKIIQPLELPHGVSLSNVEVYINPATHPTNLPGTPPTISLHKFRAVNAANATIQTQADSSVSVAIYNPLHGIPFSSLSEIVDAVGYRYYVAISGETGSDSVAGLVYLGCLATWLTTEQDPGAA